MAEWARATHQWPARGACPFAWLVSLQLQQEGTRLSAHAQKVPPAPPARALPAAPSPSGPRGPYSNRRHPQRVRARPLQHQPHLQHCCAATLQNVAVPVLVTQTSACVARTCQGRSRGRPRRRNHAHPCHVQPVLSLGSAGAKGARVVVCRQNLAFRGGARPVRCGEGGVSSCNST
jgi:hypothetical protein